MPLFFDLETTGLESTDRLCSIGFIDNDSTHYELINPAVKVGVKAMSLHHITNEKLQEAVRFSESKVQKLLIELNRSENILVAHNANFELEFLAKEGIYWQGEVIDTLRCAKHLMNDLESYALQYLRYELKLYRDEVEVATKLKISLQEHHALSDALWVKMLYDYLLELSDESSLIEMTKRAVLLEKFSFGKYKDRYIEEVVMQERSYIEWLLHQEIDEDLRYSLQHYL